MKFSMTRGRAAYIFLPIGAFLFFSTNAFWKNGNLWGWDNVNYELLAFRSFVTGAASALIALVIAWIYNRAINKKSA